MGVAMGDNQQNIRLPTQMEPAFVLRAPGVPSGSAPGVPSGSAPGVPSGSAPGVPSGSAPGVPSGSAPGVPSGSAVYYILLLLSFLPTAGVPQRNENHG